MLLCEVEGGRGFSSCRGQSSEEEGLGFCMDPPNQCLKKSS